MISSIFVALIMLQCTIDVMFEIAKNKHLKRNRFLGDLFNCVFKPVQA